MLTLWRALSKDFTLRSMLAACTIMTGAILCGALLDWLLPHVPTFLTLYPAVVLAGLFCGPLAGALAGLLGAAAAVFLWLPPRHSFALVALTDIVSIGIFLTTSSVMLWAAGLLRARLAAARTVNEALDLGLAAGEVGTWEMSLRSRRITASSAAHMLHFLPPPPYRSTPEDWNRGVTSEDVARIHAAQRKAIREGSQVAYNYRVRAGSGSMRWISARGRVLTFGGERRLLCALVDITDQMKVQDELRGERERLRLAMQAGALAVWDYDPATGHTTIDTRYAITMGFDPDMQTLTRAQIGARILPEDRARVAAEHDAAMATEQVYHIEYRILTPSGEIRWLASQGNFIEQGGGGPNRVVGIIQDITDRRKREESLRALAQTREMLVREADHRIKNSLQLVTSLLSMQLRGIEDPAAIAALHGAITRVGAIAASHLALQGSEDLRQVDLTVTIRDMCRHFNELNPMVAIRCASGPPLILDADRAIPLALAVSEVLTNALRHAFAETGLDQNGQGAVDVEIETSGADLIVRVRDNGIGMAGESVTAGLGSRIIQSLMTGLAASIDTESTPHKGTTVSLRMKLAPEKDSQHG